MMVAVLSPCLKPLLMHMWPTGPIWMIQMVRPVGSFKIWVLSGQKPCSAWTFRPGNARYGQASWKPGKGLYDRGERDQGLQIAEEGLLLKKSTIEEVYFFPGLYTAKK